MKHGVMIEESCEELPLASLADFARRHHFCRSLIPYHSAMGIWWPEASCHFAWQSGLVLSHLQVKANPKAALYILYVPSVITLDVQYGPLEGLTTKLTGAGVLIFEKRREFRSSVT